MTQLHVAPEPRKAAIDGLMKSQKNKGGNSPIAHNLLSNTKPKNSNNNRDTVIESSPTVDHPISLTSVISVINGVLPHALEEPLAPTAPRSSKPPKHRVRRPLIR
ncbi:hypothetical protein N7472_006741 [Penicillium cf. griseofulvum]|uniref:Uncharacterized protein n=1 Tax=Penicillium cf. griseofulvum TaxID=2972120 RepID=A0A9W9M9I4_9EURO|nr:hypothetical protein N7472_006741 [Penicillium cf. griseofulvum]KAJ5447249.1 hypothetical protein N7445_002070 [Penicillium cf. griseofulvum]